MSHQLRFFHEMTRRQRSRNETTAKLLAFAFRVFLFLTPKKEYHVSKKQQHPKKYKSDQNPQSPLKSDLNLLKNEKVSFH